MLWGNRIAGSPFPDRVGGNLCEGGGGVQAAQAVDDGVYGNRHGFGVLEIFSGFNIFRLIVGRKNFPVPEEDMMR
jgi:hypothetical protein